MTARVRLALIACLLLSSSLATDEDREDDERRDDDDDEEAEGNEGGCPPGCDCVPNEGGCRLSVICSGLRALPRFPAHTDCVRLRGCPDVFSASAAARAMSTTEALLPLGALAHLKLLDLHGCRLAAGAARAGALAADTFAAAGFRALRYLSLEGNNLSGGGALPATVFGGLARLRVLQLTGPFDAAEGGLCWPPDAIAAENEVMCAAHVAAANRLTALPPGCLAGLGDLRILMLHHNRLEGSLPRELLAPTPHLRVLKLLDNGAPPFRAGDAVFEPLVLPHCAAGEASRGDCLQLDVAEDTGDDLEDIWADQGSFWGGDDGEMGRDEL
jgi:hypothetical protein